jgi:hypothetical protein
MRTSTTHPIQQKITKEEKEKLKLAQHALLYRQNRQENFKTSGLNSLF